MKTITKYSLLFLVLVLMLSQPVLANEMQLNILNFSINLGWIKTTIELNGVTPENTVSINNWISDAASALDAIFNLYRKPFNERKIREVRNGLMRFTDVTDGWSNRHRVSYLNTLYRKFKSQMEQIYQSELGLLYSATCDSFISDLGLHFGRAQIGCQQGNAAMHSSGKSSMNLAINGGLSVSQELGCGFGPESAWRGVALHKNRVPADYQRTLPIIQEIVLNARGLSSPRQSIPSTSSESSSPAGLSDIVGRWQAPYYTIEFSKSGDQYLGRVYNLHEWPKSEGYTEGQVVFLVRMQSNNSYSGIFKWRTDSIRDLPVVIIVGSQDNMTISVTTPHTGGGPATGRMKFKATRQSR